MISFNEFVEKYGIGMDFDKESFVSDLSKIYNNWDMSLFFEDGEYFLSLSKSRRKDILIKFDFDNDSDDISLYNLIASFEELKTKYLSLKNVFIFTFKEVSFEMEYNISLLGVKICNLDYLNNLYWKADNDIYNVELLSHNYVALKEIIKFTEKKNRAGVVRATGTGKSFLIASIIAINKGKKILLLSPSNLILNQIKDFFGESFFESFDSITYNKLTQKTSSDILDFNYDYILLDEYHRCGAPVWENFVKKLIFNNDKNKSKIIGFTATDKRHLDGNRDMTEELFNGNICSELSLTDSISYGILKSPYYVSALYDIDEDITKAKGRILRSSSVEKMSLINELDNLKINWSKISSMPNIFKKHLDVNGKYKFIVFCKDIAHCNEMSSLLREWFLKAGFKNVLTRSINYATKNRYIVKSEFENAKLDLSTVSLLFTVSIFNEGVHCDECDGVIFLRGTISNIIFQQQLGRALSSTKSENPIVFDLMNNFKNIKRVSLVDSINESILKSSKLRNQFGLKNINYVWNIYDETKDFFNLFKEIEKKVSYTWENWFDEYCMFVKENNTNIVTKNHYNKGLYNWVVTTRTSYRKNLLSEDKIVNLKKVGFVFDVFSIRWFESFELWKNFLMVNKKEPSSLSENPEEVSLAKWCFQQRRLKKSGKIDSYRKELLDKAQFKWSLRNQDWDVNIALMKKQIEDRGTSDMTSKDIKTNPLYYWHSRILSDYINDKLPQEKINQLIQIGFSFDKANVKKAIISKEMALKKDTAKESLSARSVVVFEMRLNQYLEYVKEFSRNNVRDADVKANPSKYKGLYSWYKGVRRKDDKRVKLTDEQRAILVKVGLFN